MGMVNAHRLNYVYHIESDPPNPMAQVLTCAILRQDPPLEAILVIFGRRALFIFFV